MIQQCKDKCAHYYQDQMYGRGNRVHTESKKDAAGNTEKRCTVCSGKPRWITRLKSHIAAHIKAVHG